jgi:hypothetical protein
MSGSLPSWLLGVDLQVDQADGVLGDTCRGFLDLGDAGMIGREGRGIAQPELCAFCAGPARTSASGKNQASRGHRLTEITPCQLSGHRGSFPLIIM